MIRDFIKDLLRYLPAQIVPAVVGLFTILVVTRLFSPADYGNYVLVMATISILNIIVDWIGMSIIRFYPACEQDGRLYEFYSTVIRYLFMSIATIVVIFLGVIFVTKPRLEAQLYSLMLIGTLILISTAIFDALQRLLQVKRLVGLYSIFSIWRSVSTLGFGIALVVIFGFGVDGLLWGTVLSSAVAIPLLWRFSIGRMPWKSNNSIKLAKEMAKYGFPLVIGNLAAWILSLSDRYVLQFFHGPQEVGIYSIGYTISEKSIVLLTSLFMFASGPISMSVWEKEGVAKSQEFLTRLTRYYLIICLPIVVGLSVLARPVINILTAPEYHQGFRIVPLVALGGFCLGLQQRFQTGLTFYKKTNRIMIGIIISGLLNLVLNLWLIPMYGYVAAATTTLVSYAFLLAMMVIVSRKYFVWEFPLKSLSKVVLASIIMGVIIYPIGNSLTSSNFANIVIGICVGIVIYFLMLLLLREPREEEIQVLWNLMSMILRRIPR